MILVTTLSGRGAGSTGSSSTASSAPASGSSQYTLADAQQAVAKLGGQGLVAEPNWAWSTDDSWFADSSQPFAALLTSPNGCAAITLLQPSYSRGKPVSHEFDLVQQAMRWRTAGNAGELSAQRTVSVMQFADAGQARQTWTLLNDELQHCAAVGVQLDDGVRATFESVVVNRPDPIPWVGMDGAFGYDSYQRFAADPSIAGPVGQVVVGRQGNLILIATGASTRDNATASGDESAIPDPTSTGVPSRMQSNGASTVAAPSQSAAATASTSARTSWPVLLLAELSRHLDNKD